MSRARRHIPKMLFKSALFMVGGYALIAITTIRKVEPPPDSLLLREVKRQKSLHPHNLIKYDLYQVTRGASSVSMDYQVNRFFSTPLFSLERLILRISGISSNEDAKEPVPTTFPVGQKVDIWTVTERDDKSGEILLSWATPKIPFTGASYFCVRFDRDLERMVIQFGSLMNASDKQQLGDTALSLHGIYSKLLLRMITVFQTK
jgi:hypothetical protein